ncbi:MAG: ATP-binding cassette domain-containing protein [Marinilabiliaceae bacterium]|nr:ATP-binding cassette domain-containing protein [Marinilabiliaceae bacterium]
MKYLQAIDVNKTYGTKHVLDNLNIEVEEGSIYGLLGPNGAGKTTFIRIINRITLPDSGTVMLGGRPMVDSDVEHIGYLPEERGLYRKMKVGEQALYLAQLKGMSRHDALVKLKYWFEKFDIMSWWDKKIGELSKGMQQKVQFIVTVLHEPKLLIFDEPFSGFDPVNANLLKSEIAELRQKGATIIFSTHNMESVEELCNDITLINDSHAVLSGSVADIKQQFKQNKFAIKYRTTETPFSMEGIKISDAKTENNYTDAVVEATNETSPAELIRRIAANVELVQFHEILPSINDIFIQLVSKQNNQ